MFGLALRIWRLVLTIELERIPRSDDEDDKSTEDKEPDVLPARKFRIGFAPDDDEDDEGEDVD